jgi:hypothetical protein
MDSRGKYTYVLLPGESPETVKVREALAAGKVPCDNRHLIAMLHLTIFCLLHTGGDPNEIMAVVSDLISDELKRAPVAGSA